MGRTACGLTCLWACAVAVLAAACSPDETRRDDDSLVVVLPRDADQLDPRFVADAYGLKVSRLIFASLVTIDPRSLEVVPDLATGVEVVSPVLYRVRLRRGLRFSDGSALTADDVVATFQSVVDPALGSRYARTYSRIERVEAIDEHTVEFRLRSPHATFLTDLELPVMRAEDRHDRVGSMGGAEPIGAGPYRLTARVPGRLELVANRQWHRGAPKFDRVRLLVIRDDNTRALRLLAGAGDVALNAIPPLLLPLFEDDPRFEVRSAPGVGTTYLGFNTTASPLDDVRVRLAIAHAIDRTTLVETKLSGRARLANGWIPPGHWAHDTTIPSHGFEPELTARLLDEAGLPDPVGPAPRLRLTLRTSTDRFRLSVARALASMLRDAGIEVDVRPSETATLISDLNQGRFEMTLLQVPEVFEPHVLSWFFGSDRIPEPGVAEGANRWRLRSATLDAALERGRANPQRDVRVEAYRSVQETLARVLPVVPLWHEDVVAVTSIRASEYDVPRDGRLGTLAW